MKITDIPKVLFEEFSKKFGKGGRQKDFDNRLCVELIDGSVMCYHEIPSVSDGPTLVLELWDELPCKKHEIHRHSSESLLKIKAFPVSKDSKEYCFASLRSADFGLDLKELKTRFVLLIFQRALDLVENTAEKI